MKKYLFLLLIVWSCFSCSSFLEEYSQDLAKVQSYTDLDELLLGDAYLPVGMASSANSQFSLENKYFQAAHYMSDELTVYSLCGEGANQTYMVDEMFGWHTWQRDVGMAPEGNTRSAEDEDWNIAYHSISTCNMILGAIDEQPAETGEELAERNRVKGEAAFLRGLYYFTLVNLYGKPYSAENITASAVPLKLTAYIEDKDYEMNTVGEVYAQVIADLDLAEACLIDAKEKNHPYRADITAVYLLKSRVYLYMQQLAKALEYARKTLEKNNALLDLNGFSGRNVLSKSSPETIFSMGGHLLASSVNYSTSSADTVPNFIVSNDLAAAYTDGDNDLRTKYYISRHDVGNNKKGLKLPLTNEWLFWKVNGYRTTWNTAIDVSDNFLFRVSEAYLNGAEASAYLGDEVTAREYLQTLRDNRLEESSPITESGEELVNFVRAERQRELCLEGHRWFDLRRYSVCEKYPYSKVIVHLYTNFDVYTASPLYTYSYCLEEYDLAYTLALPYEVRNYQNTLGGNFRPYRAGSPYTVELPETPEIPDYESLGYNAGYKDGLADAADALKNNLEYADGLRGAHKYESYDYAYDKYDEYYYAYWDGYYDGYDEGYGEEGDDDEEDDDE